jgi:Tfp pilus assembly protein PilF
VTEGAEADTFCAFFTPMIGSRSIPAAVLCFVAAAAASQPQLRAATPRKNTPAISTCVTAFDSQKLDIAETCFQKVLAAAEANPDAHTYLGVIADSRNDVVAVERHFARAAALAPSRASARNNYGAILMRVGKNADAAREFAASLAISPRQVTTLLNLAQLEYASGTPSSLQSASAHLTQAYAVDPRSGKILRALVAVNIALQQPVAAARFYSEFTAVVAAEPQPWLTPDMRKELGELFAGAALHALAEQEFAAACAIPCTRPDLIVLLAQSQFQQKKIRDAGKTLELAISQHIESAAIYALLSEVYEAAGHPDHAIPAMRLALERDPRNEALHFRYGMMLVDTKAPQAAVLRLQEAVQILPQSKRLWFALGFAQVEATKLDQARESLTRALQLDPQFVPALAYMGVISVEQSAYVDGTKYYERALAADSKLPMVRYLLAEAIQKMQDADLARAERELQLALADDPNMAAARLSLGKLYANHSRNEEALQQLEAAIKLDPKLSEGHYRLGRLYQKLKRTEEARAELELFKQLGEEEKERHKAEFRTLAQKLADTMF